jgi:short-subunit dehydrogenase
MALNPKISSWTGRVVWLVGASTGIGRSAASLLHAKGADVWVSARNIDQLDSFARTHAGSHTLPLDVTDAQAVADGFGKLMASAGRVDLVVFCAGYYKGMRADEFSLPEMLKHQQVNYVGALHLLDAVLPQLYAQSAKNQGGHISLISSVAGYRGLPKSLAYGPTKAALINLTEALYIDLNPKGLGVSVVNPGFVDTPLTAQNSFKMPALLTPEQAAAAMIEGWEDGDFEIHFPKRFTRSLKALKALPDWAYFKAVKNFTGL